jgi:DnaJ-class molecular chaperone
MAKGDPQTYDTSKGFGNAKKWREAFRSRLTDDEITKALNGRNTWEVLKVLRNASKEEIKSAYRKLCIQFHPDKNPNSTSEFLAVQAAYQKLMG